MNQMHTKVYTYPIKLMVGFVALVHLYKRMKIPKLLENPLAMPMKI